MYCVTMLCLSLKRSIGCTSTYTCHTCRPWGLWSDIFECTGASALRPRPPSVPMSEAFVRNIQQFVDDEAIDLVSFEKRERKDDVTQRYLRSFRKREGVLYVGKAQEKARVMRTKRRRSRVTGATYPWIVESTAMVNHY